MGLRSLGAWLDPHTLTPLTNHAAETKGKEEKQNKKQNHHHQHVAKIRETIPFFLQHPSSALY